MPNSRFGSFEKVASASASKLKALLERTNTFIGRQIGLPKTCVLFLLTSLSLSPCGSRHLTTGIEEFASFVLLGFDEGRPE